MSQPGAQALRANRTSAPGDEAHEPEGNIEKTRKPCAHPRLPGRERLTSSGDVTACAACARLVGVGFSKGIENAEGFEI